MYLNSINLYRGIAILFIVSAHCYGISGVEIDTVPEAIFANLTAGSTIFFIFISGFLFHHIFYQKGKTDRYFSGKVKRLLIPYTVLSLVPILVKLRVEPDFWDAYFPLEGSGILQDYVIPALLYYVTGAHLVAYWYIPFAICLFLCTPLHIKFIKAKPKWQGFSLITLYIISLLIHRPFEELNVLQSVVYFTPPYLLGILCSIHKEYLYTKFENRDYLLFLVVLALAVGQALTGRFDNYQKDAFTYDGIDLILLQKSVFCIFFMIFLLRFENYKGKILTLLASTSFGIYFLHGYILQVLTLTKGRFQLTTAYPWLVYFAVWAVLILFSMLLAILIKRLLPKYSKFISGY